MRISAVIALRSSAMRWSALCNSALLTGEVFEELQEVSIYPAKQYLTDNDRLKEAIGAIERELEERLAMFKETGKFLEAQRLEQRTRYDLEMLKEVGYCSGVENYSRHLDGRAPGTHPWTMIDFLPSDYLLVIDESHMTVPQVRGMYNGDRARKETLVEFGFRLPSAMDNRPLKFDEFEEVMGNTIYTSATPGPYELEKADQVVEQIIRPTGLVDPEVEVRPTKGQVDDLVGEIRQRVDRARAYPRHNSDEADGRGSVRIFAGAGDQGPLSAFRSGDAGTHRHSA